jgi:hypothetical protein
MKSLLIGGALAAAVLVTSAPALADDPNDPLLSRSAAAGARDREIIRQLNRDQLRQVRARDARYAEGWRAYRKARCAEGKREYCER